MKHLFATTLATVIALSTSATAESWTIDGAGSQISFGSVKNSYTGEVHHLGGLSGSVSETGRAEITIDLASVETYIDIRNERMAEHVFKMTPKAMLSADLDMATISGLAVGDTLSTEIDGTLSFLGTEIDLPVEVLVARLGTDKVLVASDMIYVATDELEIEAGIDTLKALAELDDITRAVPVSFRMVFTADGQGA